MALERPFKPKKLPARKDTLLDKNLLLSILPLILPPGRGDSLSALPWGLKQKTAIYRVTLYTIYWVDVKEKTLYIEEIGINFELGVWGKYLDLNSIVEVVF